MKAWRLTAALLALAPAASAQAPAPQAGVATGLSSQLAGMGFLVGAWSSPQRSAVQDTGGSGAGVSRFTAEAGGAVLLRRDHTELFDAAGKPTGGFDILMMIYPEAGAVRADYADGTHVIHFTSAEVAAGRSVVFSSAAGPSAPVFRLGYTLTTPSTMQVSFGMVPPGGGPLRPIATGVLRRDG